MCLPAGMTSVPKYGDSSAALNDKSGNCDSPKLRSVSAVKFKKPATNELPGNAAASGIIRSRSCDNWEEYFTACNELEKRLLAQKESSDLLLRSQLENTIPEMKNKLRDQNFISAVNLLASYIQEMIELTIDEMKGGRIANIVTNLLSLQQSWEPSWPDKINITKTILLVSKFSRIVNFLVVFLFLYFFSRFSNFFGIFVVYFID